jgi:predicted deacylase
MLRVPGAAGLVGGEIPYLELGSRALGPSVTLIAGVHGCEYSSMLGLRRFLEGVDEAELQGHITAVPIVNLAAFHARTPFVVPHDGLNLNRCFPGDATGSFTPRLARTVFEQLIRPADALVDCHCGDQVEALAPFCLYDASPLPDHSAEAGARALAVAHGLPYLIRSERAESPIAGTSSAACAEIGIPAITAEAGGCGLVDEASVQAHVDGLHRVLAHLGMLPATVAANPPPEELSRFVWLRSTHAGWWTPSVPVGEAVAAGAVLGTVSPLLGGEPFAEETVVAAEAGVPVFITTSPAVAAGGLLLGVGVREGSGTGTMEPDGPSSRTPEAPPTP